MLSNCSFYVCVRSSPFGLGFVQAAIVLILQNMNSHCIDLHWGLLIYLFSVWGGVNLHSYGTDCPIHASFLGHMNHRSDVDWVLGFAYAYTRNCLGRMKIVMKSE